MTDTLPPFTSAELADLKAKAKAAMPGPWEVDDPNDTLVARRDAIGAYCYLADCGPELCSDHRTQEEERANAKHIASANPETILRLIDMIERRDTALNEIALAGENGLPPDYNSWLQFHERIARMAREALAATEPPK